MMLMNKVHNEQSQGLFGSPLYIVTFHTFVILLNNFWNYNALLFNISVSYCCEHILQSITKLIQNSPAAGVVFLTEPCSEGPTMVFSEFDTNTPCRIGICKVPSWHPWAFCENSCFVLPRNALFWQIRHVQHIPTFLVATNHCGFQY